MNGEQTQKEAPTTDRIAQHTPGPWQQYASGNQVYGGDRFFITAVQSKNPEADARLIAAAPDLLDTAKVWLRLHEQGMSGREAAIELWASGQVPNAMSALRAAIAKAEGRADAEPKRKAYSTTQGGPEYDAP